MALVKRSGLVLGDFWVTSAKILASKKEPLHG